jgi:hypothetical protein
MQHEEHLCHACRSPLSAYPHQIRARKFCSATCAVKFMREEKWQARMTHFFTVSRVRSSSGFILRGKQ